MIGEEGREAYNSLIERKHITGVEPTSCILRKPDTQYPLKSAKTLPRRSCNLTKDSSDFIPTHMERSLHNEQELMLPPLQNAPRPTTLPTRGAAYRARKAELGLFKDVNRDGSANDMNTNPMMSNRLSDSISPCESPSYVTNTSSYKFPEQSVVGVGTGDGNPDLNPLPVPPKDGKKHIQANAKRHVRKYPLIIPANGVQRTLNKIMVEEEKQTVTKTTSPTNPTSSSIRNMASVPTIKPFNINNNNSPSNMAEYENTTKLQQCQNANERTYQNIGTDDSASLQFESILEADFNKDQVLQSPDVTDGFYNFSIQKDHYHKSKEVDFDAQKLAGGLYVNEDELRNLDIDKNLVKISKQSCENKKSNESLEVKRTTSTPPPPPPPTTEPPEENLGPDPIKPIELVTGDVRDKPISSIASANVTTISSQISASSIPIISEKCSKSKSLSPKQDNELAGNALFQKVRESVDKAMVTKPLDTGASCVIKPLTEAELFSAAVNRLNDSNSVSCEDLLEFSDKKPKGHERGVDSDEVRIMMKVLGKDVSIGKK